MKILEDFVTSHIAADVPTIFDTAVPNAASTYATVTSASVSTTQVSLPSPPALEYGSTSNTFIPVRNGVQVKPKLIVPIETQNSFSPLADLVDEPEDSIIVGGSMIRHQLEELPYRWFACMLNLWLVIFCGTFSIAGRTFPLVPSILTVTCASKLTPGDGNKALRNCVHYERV